MGENEDRELGEEVVEKLKTVMDPETFLDVLTMGLIKDLIVENGNVSLTFKPTVPTCPMGIRIANDIKAAIRRVEGVETIAITVVEFEGADSLNIQLRDCA
jgi:ATP-binding protein involved in chromosome partitioning